MGAVGVRCWCRYCCCGGDVCWLMVVADAMDCYTDDDSFVQWCSGHNVASRNWTCLNLKSWQCSCYGSNIFRSSDILFAMAICTVLMLSEPQIMSSAHLTSFCKGKQHWLVVCLVIWHMIVKMIFIQVIGLKNITVMLCPLLVSQTTNPNVRYLWAARHRPAWIKRLFCLKILATRSWITISINI